MELAHYPIFGIDLVVYIGTIALILLIFVATVNRLNKYFLIKRGLFIPPVWHHRIAIIAILLIIIHVIIQYINL
jgi:hypothetical protein